MTIIHNLDIAGLLLILASLVAVRKIILELPKGSILIKWKILSIVIMLFVGGYLHLIYQHRVGDSVSSETVVSLLIFFGAIFVFMISTLSLETTRDLRRIGVLEHENITDTLMGIKNRRYLDTKLNDEFIKYENYSTPFSVLMLDIDHFKSVNDTYGHDVGDEVLKIVGERIQEYVRDGDCVARYGGEEIVIVCPSTTEDHAFNLAERLRIFIENLPVCSAEKCNTDSDLHITVSIGVSECNSEHKEANDIIKSADTALYKAKNGGRNCVVLYESSLQEN